MRKIFTMALAAATAGACALIAFVPDADARRGGGGFGGGGGFRGGGFHGSFARASSFHAAPAFRATSVLRPAPIYRATVVHRPAIVHRPIVHRSAIVHRRIYGAPIYVASYGTGCAWLRRRAIETGSAYWWDRYHRCIGHW